MSSIDMLVEEPDTEAEQHTRVVHRYDQLTLASVVMDRVRKQLVERLNEFRVFVASTCFCIPS